MNLSFDIWLLIKNQSQNEKPNLPAIWENMQNSNMANYLHSEIISQHFVYLWYILFQSEKKNLSILRNLVLLKGRLNHL